MPSVDSSGSVTRAASFFCAADSLGSGTTAPRNAGS
jgi:hypothetical protein